MIPKHKSRRVIVGNTPFRHKVSTTPKSKGVYRLNITVQSENHNASKMVVEGLIKKDSSVWPLTNYRESHFYPTVSRQEVEWCIREAINRGWNYTATGPNFVLRVSNDIFRLDFWLSPPAYNPIVVPSPENDGRGEQGAGGKRR